MIRENEKYIHAGIEFMMEPKPCYKDLYKVGFNAPMPNADINVPNFLNRMSSNWKMLSYSSGKAEKKIWRLFKNSSLISQHVRKAFQTAACSE